MAPSEGSAGFTFSRDLPLTQAAIEFARERHGGQRRGGDGASFLAHPLEAASLLERSGYPDLIVAAAVLHDVLEDTDTEVEDLASRFGSDVAELVRCLSDDPAIEDLEARKAAVRVRVSKAGWPAQAIFAADKVSKVRELRALAAQGLSEDELRTKLVRYQEALAMLEGIDPTDRLVQVLRFELEAFEKLPPDASQALGG